jgi:hypothetical protein
MKTEGEIKAEIEWTKHHNDELMAVVKKMGSRDKDVLDEYNYYIEEANAKIRALTWVLSDGD